MPYVTNVIYDYLPLKDENIMISSYPEYDKKQIYMEDEKEVEEIIDFVKSFRTTVKENNIVGNYQVKINSQEELIINLLKLSNKITDKNLDMTEFKVSTKNYEAIIYYEKELTEEDIRLKEKQINELTLSIKKREALLNNDNFTSKAPKDLVLKEKQKLNDEKEELAKLTS